MRIKRKSVFYVIKDDFFKVFIIYMYHNCNPNVNVRTKYCSYSNLLNFVLISSKTHVTTNKTLFRSNKLSSSAPANVKEQGSKPSTSPNIGPRRTPHGPPSKLHGPHDGQEYYAIDNIIADADFRQALSLSNGGNMKLGVIIRTWTV